MNDRFKFRFWCEKAKQFVVFDETALPYHWVVGNSCFEYFGLFNNEDFIPEQCTKIKDKNGRLIYEGDVVSCENAKGIVRFGEHGDSWAGFHYGFFIDWFYEDGCPRKPTLRQDLMFWLKEERIGIIGNIHENPEVK